MKVVFRVVTTLHVWLYRISQGRLGSTMGPQQILLLDSIGRKSGKKYTTPVTFIRDGNKYVISASAAGADKHPGWYYNLRSNPKTTVQVKDKRINVVAQQAGPKDRKRLWARLVTVAPNFQDYQKKTTREIQMFILRPQNDRK